MASCQDAAHAEVARVVRVAGGSGTSSVVEGASDGSHQSVAGAGRRENDRDLDGAASAGSTLVAAVAVTVSDCKTRCNSVCGFHAFGPEFY